MKDRLHQSLLDLAQLLDGPLQTGTALGNWRWTARQRLASVRDDLARQAALATDGWLAARESSVVRERGQLMHRIANLSPLVLNAPDPEVVRDDLRRLLVDINHHRQRLHDLAYDEVELELGGSE